MSERGSHNGLETVPGSRRGRPGRPRKGDCGIFAGSQSGHSPGTEALKDRSQSSNGHGALVQITTAPLPPRLLDLHAAAQYLALSEWTVRELEQQGILARVRIPLANHGELRKLLFDRADLDRLVEAWKEGGIRG